MIDRTRSSSLFIVPFFYQTNDYQKIDNLLSKSEDFQRQKIDSEMLLNHISNTFAGDDTVQDSQFSTWRVSQDFFHEWTGYSAHWKLCFRRDGKPINIEFQFQKIELVVCRGGIAFVIIHTEPKTDSPDDWLDFVHYFRFINGERNVSLDGERIIPEENKNDATREFQFVGCLAKRIEKLFRCVDGSGIEIVFDRDSIDSQVVSYPIIFLNSAGENETQFENFRIRLRNGFHSQQNVFRSAEISNPELFQIEYTKNHWFIFSLSGCSFLAVDSPDSEYFRTALPHHLKHRYGTILWLSIYQRLLLTKLSLKVASEWLPGNRKSKTRLFDELRNEMISFTASGFFSQVATHENYQLFYERIQEEFRIPGFYDEVRNEIRELFEFLQVQQANRLEFRVNAFAVLLGIPSLTIALLALNVNKIATNLTVSSLCQIMVGSIAIACGLLFFLNRN